MTCKPILEFLKENGIAPTPENKKRWQAGWTLSELREGKEKIISEYEKQFEEFRKKKEERNEQKIQMVIEKEKERRNE